MAAPRSGLGGLGLALSQMASGWFTRGSRSGKLGGSFYVLAGDHSGCSVECKLPAGRKPAQRAGRLLRDQEGKSGSGMRGSGVC